MSRSRLLALAGLLLLLFAGVAQAEEGILVVHVTYLDKRPLPRVRIGTTGDGSIETTDVGGRARIRLAHGVKAEQEVELQVVPGEKDNDFWVFISPWDQRVRVPPFDGGQAVPVVLAKKADKEALLGSSEGRKVIEQKILTELSKLQQAKSEITEEQRRTVLQAQASAYGLKPEDVDAAIRAASQKSPDLYEQGLAALYEKNYPVASERLKGALEASEKELAQTQERVADRAFFLGQSLYQQGRYSEAVIAVKRAADLRGEHAETLNRLGVALEGAGNYPEAEAVLNRALIANQHSNSNLETIIQGNLALVLDRRGDLAGARRLGEQVLESRRRQLGADHPATLKAMNNLALTLKAQGDLSKARQLQEQVLESCRRQLGADHLATLTAIDNLAQTLRDQGDLPKARQLQEQVLELFRHQLGASHPDTLAAMNNLALTLKAQGDLPKARQLQEEVLESLRRQLGTDHPATLTAMDNLASTLGAQGDLVRERSLQEQVLQVRLRLLGPKHSSTSLIEWNLLMTLRTIGDQGGAREMEKSLAWLLAAPEAELSAQQRQIRQYLAPTPPPLIRRVTVPPPLP